MDQLMNRLAHLGEADQLADLGTGQVVVSLPGEVLLFHLSQNVFCQSLEVAQGSLTRPHPLVDHLAPVEGSQRQSRPASPQADLEDGTHNSAGRLLDIHHVGHQRKSLQLQLGNVGLQQDIHLGRRLVRAALHWHGHSLHQLLHLHLLFLSYRDVLELMREREEPQKLDVRHHGPQVVVVGGNGRVLNVVVAGHPAQRCHLHLPSALVVLDEVVLVQECQGAVDQVDAPLLQEPILLCLIRRDAVEPGGSHHAHVEVSVA
mmetsp:Transcript_89753/g.214515  ORF Transcript_89753/g.214515 Transcript_89753/m.214515 type:complete len:260 (-) Transcript_89753:2928-3707(-)